MKRQRVTPQGEKKIKRGICLLEARDMAGEWQLEQVVRLVSIQGAFLGRAYLSKQNKGIGWFFSPSEQELTMAFFVDLFETAKKKRQAYREDSLTTAYRLFNQDGDGFGGLTVDLYGDYAVFSWYNSYVFSRKMDIVSAFCEVYPEVLGAYEKIRFQGVGYESAHLYGEEAPASFSIKENGVAYQVFLNEGLMTGIFLDQHLVRSALVDGLASGKSVLNMFSYTAAFSIAAAMGGACRTTSVDLAKRSRDLSRAHFEANGIPLDSHQFVVMDVFDYIQYAKRKGLRYDLIILDPPSFARNKKQTFSVAKDYHRLIGEVLEILEPEGRILASTNAATLSLGRFKKEIEKGLAGRTSDYQTIYRLPSDFAYNKNDESSNYLKVVTIQVHE